ncbi:Tn7-like element transposition protein TnsE, partial [Acinetobacter ursingii]|uniref:Tn7-like element transposition protein TnsE n=1 Tax=Acinetobacter ursingii TaxID=108980 RepID=UPI0021CD98B6
GCILLFSSGHSLKKSGLRQTRYGSVQNTLNWPISFIKEIASRQARFNHPRIDEGQQVAIDDLEGWAKRIYVGLNK